MEEVEEEDVFQYKGEHILKPTRIQGHHTDIYFLKNHNEKQNLVPSHPHKKKIGQWKNCYKRNAEH